ncbi:hypothetical protein CANARDRAFT_27675 [[Candida] arabinofermentans NRRL YB-2248]|uniref:Zn(2)-C6 fungal-type domain-containing protein n=1 Tax=[Candida] arabinofermentans NRRL YB-2248 TaxID=983967 RepID=A0A1E4T3Y3_9ASCO|nr:hypothetical protein CANARDRAFT_27675 [[Candida] arabinofermentans NRRL YB-2248]
MSNQFGDLNLIRDGADGSGHLPNQPKNNKKRSQDQKQQLQLQQPSSLATTIPKKKMRRPHTRAIKACTMCRRQKTRCLKSNSTISCLRCLSLSVSCSFEDDFRLPSTNMFAPSSSSTISRATTGSVTDGVVVSGPSSSVAATSSVSAPLSNNNNFNLDTNTLTRSENFGYDAMPANSIPSSLLDTIGVGSTSSAITTGVPVVGSNASVLDRKLDLIGNDLKDVLRILNTNGSSGGSANNRNELFDPNGIPSVRSAEESFTFNLNSTSIQSIKHSPFYHVLELSKNLNGGVQSFPDPVLDQMNLLKPSIESQTDLISINLLSYDQAIKLLDIFRDRYGRWISFPDNYSTEKLLKRIRLKCPLLLTVACALSLKYSDPRLKEQVYDSMLEVLKTDLKHCLVDMPNNLEFLQCLIILSIYSVSLSSEKIGLRLNGWYLSSLGIHLCLDLNNFGIFDHLYDPNDVEFEFNELTTYRIFNTLILIHMAYTLLSGKITSISMNILKPKRFFELNLSTNFDYRIIAEIEIYIIAYRFLQLDESIETIKVDIKEWLSQWYYLFNKTANEFVEIDYHLAELMINLKVNRVDVFAQSLNFKDIQIFKVIDFHATKILKLISSIKDDSYFAFLSDQIHLIIVYDTTIVIKLLGYNDKAKVKLQSEVEESLKFIVRLIQRYKRISTSESGSLSRYSLTLEACLQEQFPMLNIQEMASQLSDDASSGKEEGGPGQDDDDEDDGEEEDDDHDDDDDVDDDDDEATGTDQVLGLDRRTLYYDEVDDENAGRGLEE